MTTASHSRDLLSLSLTADGTIVHDCEEYAANARRTALLLLAEGLLEIHNGAEEIGLAITRHPANGTARRTLNITAPVTPELKADASRIVVDLLSLAGRLGIPGRFAAA